MTNLSDFIDQSSEHHRVPLDKAQLWDSAPQQQRWPGPEGTGHGYGQCPEHPEGTQSGQGFGGGSELKEPE